MSRSFPARIALPAISAALLLTGCGSTISGNPQAASGDDLVPATTHAAPTTKPSGKPSGKPPAPGAPTTTRADKGGNTDFHAQIGDCVKLGGTTDDATIEKASCGSQDANYKVTGKAPKNAQCGSDSDQAYYETLNGIETGALCLTIDWVVGDCLELGGDDPHRISCSAHGTTEAVKVRAILQNTSSVDDCSTGDKGYVYDERNFVVCVDSL